MQHSSSQIQKDVVLVVDDDLAVLEIMREILSGMGCEVILSATMAQARQAIRNNAKLAAILCDHRLPDGLGLEFLRELKVSNPDPIRVLVTGYVDAEAALAAINRNEIFRFLPKPCSIEDIKVVVNQALERHRTLMKKTGPQAAARGIPDQIQPLKGTTLGDYEVGDLLGRGGMAIIYRGRQISLDRPVAIKVLPPDLCSDREYVDRFLREARAAAHLNHPNIIQIYDAGVSGNIYFFVMEYVDGKNMGQIVREQGRLAEHDALRVVQYTAMGLAFAHSRGIVHRDVKPENIMRTSHGVVKVGDLGLVKWKPNEYDHSLTMSGNTMGTPFYISPEQIRGVKDIDGRADIYSLGMTFYHFLAGRPAFCQGTAAEIMAHHLSDEPPPLQELNPEVSQSSLELVSLMITKKREDRISDMGMIPLLITDILGEPSSATTPVTAMPRPISPLLEERFPGVASRVLYLMGAVIIGLFLAVLVILVWKLSRPKKPAVSSLGTKTSTVEAASQPASPTAVTDQKGTSSVVSGPEEVREYVVSRESHHILEITISPFPRVLDVMAQRDASTRESRDPRAEEIVDLVVGRSERGEFRSLVRVDWDEKQWQKVFPNISRCTTAVLEMVPVFYSGKSPTDYLEVEVVRVLKPWGNNPSLRLLLNPKRYFGTFADETNWEWASRSMGVRWDRKGAEGSVFDLDKTLLPSVANPGQTSFRISGQELNRPLRINVLEDLRRLADEAIRSGKGMVHYGWMIRPVRGSGEVHFRSALSGGRDGSRIVFMVRCKPGEEPLTSIPGGK